MATQTITWFAETTGMARETVKKRLDAADLVPVPGARNAALYETPSAMAWRVLDTCHTCSTELAEKTMGLAFVGEADPYDAMLIKAKSMSLANQVKDSWRNLAEIHAAPHWLWVALVKQMIESGWTVQVTRDKTAAFKEVADPGR